MANIKDYKIATIGSHTALQILKGAKDEGFSTICICQKGKRKPYESYGVADEIIEISKSFSIDAKIIGVVENSKSKKLTLVTPFGTYVYPE